MKQANKIRDQVSKQQQVRNHEFRKVVHCLQFCLALVVHASLWNAAV